MDLRQLRYFEAVAKHGHFGRAAQHLNIVQPALSMQIRALEDELGGALFVRTSRRVELTAAGQLLLAEAERTLAQATRAKEVVQSSLRGEIGKVRIGFVGNAVLTGKITGDLQAFRAEYPSAVIELAEMAPHEQSSRVLDGTIDVGYCAQIGFSLSPELSVIPVLSMPLVIVMSSNHALARLDMVPLAALSQECFILYGVEDDDEGPLSELRAQGFSPRAVKRVPTTLGVLALAASGEGVGLAPEAVGQLPIPGLTFKKIAEITTLADLVILGRRIETAGSVLAYRRIASR
jgi:DNA-binding transcriptional LysR family regulator